MSAPTAPSNSEVSIPKELESFLKVIGPEAFWSHPATKFGVELVQDRDFTSAIARIHEMDRSTQFYAYEGLLILVLWAFRAWRLGKVNTLLSRIWTQAWIAVVFWALALFLVPLLVWGEAYRVGLSHLVRSVLRHFLA